ncbi:GNAT family N-acetyltransferase [Oceaniglobus roseus]|uniref:GNAT family N-acetyltransferase n=1 Tax=Oceaniglobus roseus TaxID=1737570 RepID=UPI000C7F6638|nr:GNAT family N-acetyltransferase [Kandeliimicrobium roseum]
MSAFAIRLLSPDTWPAFAALAEAHNGVWGGCWCMGFHAKGPGWGVSAGMNRDEKKALVSEGRAHAALVFEDAACVGWCQYGPPAELPRIKNRRAYLAGDPVPADWRITCFFVGRTHRGRGVASAALDGALDAIAEAGGGQVEAFPEDTDGRKVSGAFLFNGALGMFEARGFARIRPLGKHKWLVARTLAPARARAAR